MRLRARMCVSGARLCTCVHVRVCVAAVWEVVVVVWWGPWGEALTTQGGTPDCDGRLQTWVSQLQIVDEGVHGGVVPLCTTSNRGMRGSSQSASAQTTAIGYTPLSTAANALLRSVHATTPHLPPSRSTLASTHIHHAHGRTCFPLSWLRIPFHSSSLWPTERRPTVTHLKEVHCECVRDLGEGDHEVCQQLGVNVAGGEVPGLASVPVGVERGVVGGGGRGARRRMGWGSKRHEQGLRGKQACCVVDS